MVSTRISTTKKGRVMAESNSHSRGRSPRRLRCNLKTSGHGRNPALLDLVDRPLSWVQGTIDILDIALIDEVPGAQPVRFVPDLALPHGTTDPVGISIELFHHSSVIIRNLVARGFTPIWYPVSQALVLGHRTFHMSLTPVPECSALEPTLGEDRRSMEDVRNMILNLRIAAYAEAFTSWSQSGVLPEPRGAGMLDDLANAWDQPGFVRSDKHIEFRDVLIAQFRESV